MMKCGSHSPGRLAHVASRKSCQRLRFAVLGLVMTGTSVAGCQSPAGGVAHLQGKVTLNGAQIPDDAKAFVVFVPDGDSAKTVTVPVTNGRYDSPRTPVGPVKVHFEISREVGPTKTSERTGQPYRDIESLVPAKYATGIPLEVKVDDAHQDFQLTN